MVLLMVESGKLESGTRDEGNNNFIRGSFLFKFGFGWFGWFFVRSVYTQCLFLLFSFFFLFLSFFSPGSALTSSFISASLFRLVW